jgi:hypothetical protein
MTSLSNSQVKWWHWGQACNIAICEEDARNEIPRGTSLKTATFRLGWTSRLVDLVHSASAKSEKGVKREKGNHLFG